ncbi:MAG: (d)CMP kinase [Coriobacteriia bacterium]|nr:(d)CMP kinase [Coriobacteriia bacterium]
MIIAIDGPAGSGKSSVAKVVAARLGFHYLDTGAMYRAVASRALAHGISLSDESAVAAIAQDDPIEFGHDPGDPMPSRVFIAGQDVTDAIRTPEVDDAVSPVAKLALVRSAMVQQQRHIASHSNIVVEGRDIGTVVFPDAQLKVFLTASAQERARRRAAQQSAGGHVVDAAAVHAAILRRDEIDSTRAHSPLAAAPDAVLLDTTTLTFDEVVERIVELAQERRV